MAFLRPALILTLVFSASSAWAGSKSMVGAPLAWTPTSSLAESVGALNLLPLNKVKIWVEPFVDSRSDKALIGQNTENDQPRTVSTQVNMAEFLGTHAVGLYREAGIPLAASAQEATVILKMEILRCMVNEKDTYKGELTLKVEIRSGDGVIWQGTLLGESTRWGRSFKLENYQETICDTLVDAIAKSLKSPSFLQALAGQEPGTTSAPVTTATH